MNEVLLFSGGLDSFYLAVLLRPRKLVHFIVSLEQSLRALKLLGLLLPDSEVILFDHRPYLKKLHEELKNYNMIEYLCLACKRGMVLRASEEGTPILGDSLGQVASQTLYNAQFISEGIKALRPLFGSDKEDLEADHPLRPLAEAVSALKCPFKPSRVATKAPRGPQRAALEYLIRKNLHLSRKLGVWRSPNLTALG